MFVTTAIAGSSSANDPSDSSASVTNHGEVRRGRWFEHAVDSAEHEARVDAAGAQHGVGHGGRRRFSVRAADRDAAPAANKLREHFAAVQHRSPSRRAAAYSGLRRSIAELTTTVCAPRTLSP